MKKTILLFGLLALSCIGFAQVSQPISNLEVQVLDNDKVFLTWDLPDGSDAYPMNLSWLMSDSINEKMQAGYDTYLGSLYDTLDLRNFVGRKIESVSFYKVSNWTHVVYIWEQKRGEEMHALHTQRVPDETPFGLNTILLDEDLFIEPSTQYWFSLRIKRDQNQQGYSYPFGMVFGEPGVVGKSNLFMDPGFYTWEIIPDPEYHFWIKACLVDSEKNQMNSQSRNEANPLTGYRIYRDGELIKEIPYIFMTYFTDTEFTRETDVEYCVTAVYGDEESEPVCATASITGVADHLGNDGIGISPNPTNGLVRIEGATVSEVQVYNTMGQLVKTVESTNEIDMGHLPEGVYFLRITAIDGRLHVGKITVNK